MPSISKINLFLKYDLWRTDVSSLPAGRALVVSFLRILLASFRGFVRDNCALRASALTLGTLLSIVPVLAMAFGIAQGFGLEKAIEQQLLDELRGHEEVARWLVNFAYSFLHTTRGGLVAGIGVLALLLTVVKVLKDVEKALNSIWKTKEQRSIPRTISDYITIIVVAPILLIVSSSLTVMVTSEISAVTHEVFIFKYIGSLVLPVLKLLPYCVIWVLFTFIYMSIPNTKVNFTSAFWGGIIAGTIFQVFQWTYITFQVGVSKYNTIYGSFAALPLFIIWLQTSWSITLFGAEISYAYQTSGSYELSSSHEKISHNSKILLALNICYMIVKNFQNAEKCSNIRYISSTLHIPIALVRDLIEEMLDAGLICATSAHSPSHPERPKDNDQVIYQPAVSTDRFSIKYVIDCLERHGNNELILDAEPGSKRIAENMKVLSECIEKSSSNSLLKDL